LSQQGMFRTRVIGTGLRPLNRIIIIIIIIIIITVLYRFLASPEFQQE
jgi:hypothetical protein